MRDKTSDATRAIVDKPATAGGQQSCGRSGCRESEVGGGARWREKERRSTRDAGHGMERPEQQGGIAGNLAQEHGGPSAEGYTGFEHAQCRQTAAATRETEGKYEKFDAEMGMRNAGNRQGWRVPRYKRGYFVLSGS